MRDKIVLNGKNKKSVGKPGLIPAESAEAIHGLPGSKQVEKSYVSQSDVKNLREWSKENKL